MGKGSIIELGPEINILVWNIHKGKHAAWFEDFRLLSEDKSLILLQEAIMNTSIDSYFSRSEDWEWVMGRSFKEHFSQLETGVKTGSIATSRAQIITPSHHSEPIVRTNKMLLSTYYSLKTRVEDMLVLNVHGLNFVTLEKYKLQIQQIENELQDFDGSVILAGDFNTWAPGRYESLLTLATRNNLEKVSIERKAKWRHLNKHLDHVFYRDLTLLSSEIREDICSSDHHPIIVKFKI